ncbi:MAG: beta-galactosidase trimerization domain-containing protein [Planctomycetota bacterium]|nr:beta-galactosidase trimerization domain-containing protein [Planctomycetota bacterium]
MARSWYETSCRKLFFDFHSPGTAAGLAAAFDAERWAKRVQQANAQAVSVFTKCGFGYSFYQKGRIRYQHPHLPKGLDMLEEQVTALHKRGLRAIGYYHTFNSEPIARDHPDWIERDAEGKPRGISICLLSPLATQWMLPHIEEIVTNYDVDSMFFDGTYAHSPCFCEACRKRFADASGGLPIPGDKKDPTWARFVAWKLQAFRELRQAICDTIHRRRPDIVVSLNWVYAPRMPEIVPDGVGALVADIPPEDQVFNGSYFSAHWAMLNRPFDIMNSAFLQWWGDWGCKPAVAMQQEVATAIAHGGLTWIGYQMRQDFDVAPAVMAELTKTLAFVREREPVLAGAEPVPCVAVLHSTSANLTGGEAAFHIDEATARGAHRLLTEGMIPHHFLNEKALMERLSEFRAVILPDQRYLPPDLVTALPDWVKAGGVLIATALTGTLDDTYRDSGGFVLQDLLGVRREGVYDQPHAYIEVTDPRLKAGTLDMPHLAEAKFVLARPIADDVRSLARLRTIYLRSDGKFLLRWSPVGEDSGYPAITLRRVGKGWAAYLAGQVFRAYQTKNQWNLKHIVANLLRMTMPDPLVTVEAPAWLEVTVMRQRIEGTRGGHDRLLVHLVNQHGDHPVDGNYRCVEQIQPVQNVKVRVRCLQRPARVTLEPDGARPTWKFAKGVVTVNVPEVAIHRVVALHACAGRAHRTRR